MEVGGHSHYRIGRSNHHIEEKKRKEKGLQHEVNRRSVVCGITEYEYIHTVHVTE